jgi:hypothetical protein
VTSQLGTGLSTSRVDHVRWYNGASWASRIENGVFYTKIMRVTRNVPYDGLVYDLTVQGTAQIPTASGLVHNCSFCPSATLCRNQ